MHGPRRGTAARRAADDDDEDKDDDNNDADDDNDASGSVDLPPVQSVFTRGRRRGEDVAHITPSLRRWPSDAEMRIAALCWTAP